MSLDPEMETEYTTIIDSILAASDLNTISEKRIRKGLEAAVQHDLSAQKHLIKGLIMTRFDKFHAQTSATTSSPGETPAPPKSHPSKATRKADKAQLATDSDAAESPKKKAKLEKTDDDARLAAMLQAEENSRARPTRRSANRKPPVTKKRRSASKPKSSAKVEDEGSGASDSSDKKKANVNRSGGFHKQLTLSAPLAELLGETTLSRPETVKRLWVYFRENGLQDPNDKRQIRCDDALKSVFKQDRVHMFTMNKMLSNHLFAPDE